MGLTFSSCDLFRKAEVEKPEPIGDQLDPIQGRVVYDPETGTYVVIEDLLTEKMDTIIWKNIPESEYPPITSEAVESTGTVDVIREGENGSMFLSRYNVAIALPFLANRFSTTGGNIDIGLTEWTLNFYGGMKIALEDLDAEGIPLDVQIIDTEASEATVSNQLRSPEMLNANLIIGPYRRDNVRLLADFAQREDKVLVSPYSASSGLAGRNPNYIQVSPTLATHCEAITRHARARYRTDQIVLVCRNKDNEVERLRYFQEENFRLAGTREAPKLREYIVQGDVENFDAVDVLPLMQFSDTTVFILPTWASESFVSSFLRKVDLTRSEMEYHHVVVYGMPQWMDYERIDYEYYEKLNVHVSSNMHLDPLATDVKFFKRRFYENYGAPPSNAAFIGYDVMHYFGRMLNKYGTKFQYMLERDPEEVMHTIFDFERVVVPTTTGFEEPPIVQFENKFVNILRFKDYQFQPANL